MNTSSSVSWGQGVVIHAQRLLRRWMRSSVMLMITVAMPIMFVLVIRIMFEGMIEAFSGEPMDMASVSVMIVFSTMFASAIMGAGNTVAERKEGLPDRVRVFPGHPSTGIYGRVLAEWIRAVLAGVTTLIVGIVCGADFGGVAGLLGVLTLTCVIGLVAGLIGVLLGYVTETPQGAIALVPLLMAAMSFNTAMMPRELYADAARPFVDASPVTALANLGNDIIDGHLTAGHILPFVAWYGGLALLAAVVLARKAGVRER
ncbi:MAG: ABC transporter permease [Actinomycetaceae bacterium]|nr:ABC transporter permease [Actinomycetaceae bacterium]